MPPEAKRRSSQRPTPFSISSMKTIIAPELADD
jgi:hypothetical protein